MTTLLLPQVESYVRSFFHQHRQPALVYHAFAHTLGVVQAAEQLAEAEQLEETARQTVLTAAWFHDLGYLVGPPEQHEEAGARLAADFLRTLLAPPEFIERVQGCIRATKIPQSPLNRLEEILCDADLSHLGGEGFKDQKKLLRAEREALSGEAISGKDWRRENIRLLETHRYFTRYALAEWQPVQDQHLQRLREKQAEKNEESEAAPDPELPPVMDSLDAPDLPPPEPPESKKKSKDNRSERGIETMFRTTSTNHLRLSEIADSKANIMISVNSIMVSVLVSVLPRRIEENPYLIIPASLFLGTALLTIIFAVLATRPNVTQGTFNKEDILQKKTNLLFFGNFHQMSLEDYDWGVNEMMRDSSFLYGSMTRDIYSLGKVLAKKYRLLRLAYNIFMVGFVASILGFVLTFLFSGK